MLKQSPQVRCRALRNWVAGIARLAVTLRDLCYYTGCFSTASIFLFCSLILLSPRGRDALSAPAEGSQGD